MTAGDTLDSSAGNGRGREMPRWRCLAATVSPVLAAVWLGAILGVSFIATPIKFAAPLLDAKAALDVGRVTFGLFGPLELGFASLLCLAVAFGGFKARWTMVALLCLALTLFENFGLRPALDERLGKILTDQTVPQSSHHAFYVVTQSMKAVSLLVMSFLRRL